MEVRYTLKEFTLVFDLKGANSHPNDPELYVNGTKYTGSSYSIIVKLGQDITGLWPIEVYSAAGKTNKDGYKFNGWLRQGLSSGNYTSVRLNVTADMINNPGGSNTTTYNAQWDATTTVELHYWLEADEGTKFNNLSGYNKDKNKVTLNLNGYFIDDPGYYMAAAPSKATLFGQKEIAGYKIIGHVVYTGSVGTSDYNHIGDFSKDKSGNYKYKQIQYFFYKRINYSITYIYNGNVVGYTAKSVSSTDVKAKTSIGYTAGDFSYDDTNYKVTFNVTDGSLEIKPAAITVNVTGDKVSVDYDGKEHTATKVTFDADKKDLFDASKVEYTAKAQTSIDVIAATAIGYTAGDFSYKDTNYSVTFDVTDGSLEITPAKVTVTAKAAEKVYGEKMPELSATVTGVVDADKDKTDLIKYSLASSHDRDNVGTYADAITVSGEATQGNYTVSYVFNDLTITPRTLTIKAKDVESIYTGAIIGPNGYEIIATEDSKADGLVYGDTVKTVVIEGGARNVGPHNGEFTVDKESVKIVGTDNKDKTGNYKLNVVSGDLLIIDREKTDNKFKLDITAAGGTYLYDGTQKTGTVTVSFGANKVVRLLAASLAGDTYAVDFNNDGTVTLTYNSSKFVISGLDTSGGAAVNAGTTRVLDTSALKIVDEGGQDVSSQFAITVNNADLVINKRNVTLMSASDAKVYDGEALTNHTVTVGGDGFAQNEGAYFNVTGSIIGDITKTSSVDNLFTYTLTDGTNAQNYDITVVYGTLTITPRIFNLTVHYVFEDGTEAAPDYNGRYASGTAFKVVSPAVDGYKPNAATVTDVMPDHDLELTVIYATDFVPGDYTIEEIVEEPTPRAELGGDHSDGLLPFLIAMVTFFGQMSYNTCLTTPCF